MAPKVLQELHVRKTVLSWPFAPPKKVNGIYNEEDLMPP